MTKTVIRFFNKGGIVYDDMPETFVVEGQYTDVPPIEDVPIERQSFIPDLNEWIDLGAGSGESELPEDVKAVLMMAVQSADLTDEQALIVAEFYEEWQSDVEYGEGKIVRGKGDDPLLYRCRQKHISDEVNQPGLHTSAIWEVINVDQSGTIDDPIPAVANMQYYKDKYYLEDDVLYLCTRDSEIPLSHLPSQLVGHYFEIVEKTIDE